MERFLKNQELHEFAQWFSFHCELLKQILQT